MTVSPVVVPNDAYSAYMYSYDMNLVVYPGRYPGNSRLLNLRLHQSGTAIAEWRMFYPYRLQPIIHI